MKNFHEACMRMGKRSCKETKDENRRLATKRQVRGIVFFPSVLVLLLVLSLVPCVVLSSSDARSTSEAEPHLTNYVRSHDEPSPGRRIGDDIEETDSDGVEVGLIHTGPSENAAKSATRNSPSPEDDSFHEIVPGPGGPFDAKKALDNLAFDGIKEGPMDRCDWLWNQFEQQTSWMARDQRYDRYQHQVTDASTYYRSSSHIFWVDFFLGNWSQALLWSKLDKTDRDALDEYSTFTWVSGDQHLLNFGAWKNRHGDIVYGMNDFDEGAVHCFQVDVLRLAVSTYQQVLTTLESEPRVVDIARRVVGTFVNSYVRTVRSYVGNEEALTHELTVETSHSLLREFLEELEENTKEYSRKKLLKKYAKYDHGTWKLDKGTSKKPKHKLAEIPSQTEVAIRAAFSGTEYGGSLQKFGWSLTGRWDDSYYQVLDVASRIGSGIGSYGVDRYYVLICGNHCGDEPSDNGPFLLDVKEQPPGSFRQVLHPTDAAWYDQRFTHSAVRVTEAQRRLTAYSDPFSGWIVLDGKPFTVRERSPWKESFDLENLDSEQALLEFVVQLGATTATSHVRGNIAEAPGDFKNVIDKIMGKKDRREAWIDAVVNLTTLYHAQVVADFECFQNRVNNENFD